MPRKYVSLILLYSLVVMIGGIVFCVMTHGRVVYWTSWRFLGVDKDQWDSLYIFFWFLMIFFGIWHVTLSWKSIVNYLKGKARILTSKEFLMTTNIAIVVDVGTITGTVVGIGGMLRGTGIMPPAPHAKLSPLKKVARIVGLFLQNAIDVLMSGGIRIESSDEVLKEIEAKNNTAPRGIYKIILKKPEKIIVFRLRADSGTGRLTLIKVRKELQIYYSV